MAIRSGSNILRWPGHPVTRESFLVLLESTVIKFVWSTGKLSFSGKSKFEGEECLLLQDEHIIVLCFYFSCWLMKCILCRKWKVCLSKRGRTVCGLFKINACESYQSVVLCRYHKDAQEETRYKCFVLIEVYFSYWPWYVFAFFWWQEWQVLDGVAVLGHFQHCSVMRLSCLDELVNN